VAATPPASHTHVEADITDLQAYALASALSSHTGDATIHFTEGSIAHANISGIGVNSHAQIDSAITAFGVHFGDSTIHFTQAAISIPASQISDFATAVGADAAVAANTAKVGLVTSTTAALEAIANAINTGAAKELGYMVLNTDTGLTVFASGNADGSDWHFYDSSVAHTPV
jgi:hypothetical protein